MFNTVYRKVIAGAVSAAVLLAIVFGARWYISQLQNNLKEAESKIQVLNEAVGAQQKTIEQLTRDIVAVQEANRAVANISTKARTDVDTLRKRFEKNLVGKDRDIGYLATVKPESIQRIINSGSADAARCMELASGAAPTAAEIAAIKPSEINTLCPRLANPNYVSR